MSVPVNTKPNIFYSSKEYVATITDTDTLADGFYGTVILNKGTAFTLTLGTAANCNENRINFINIGAGTVTISDGGVVIILLEEETCSATCDGTDWYSFKVEASSGGDYNIDGGVADSVYTAEQSIDGGDANG